jgi:hypothetical protein
MPEPHEERADELEKEADFLEKAGNRVEGLVKDAREEWKSKKSSNQSPGAMDAADAAPGGLGEDEESRGVENVDAESGGPA